MDQRLVGLSVLFLAIIVSGCSGGGNDAQSQGNKAIAVNDITVQPTSIFEGSNVRVRMAFTNVGQLPAKALISKSDDNKGGQILTNHCPDIFSVESFSASSSNVSQTKKSYTLAPNYKVRLNWNLKQDTSNVPLNGYDCNLRFEVPFNYSVEAFQQIQVKDTPGVKGSKNLFSKSSQGPLKLELETIGSSAPRGAPTFLKNDSGEVLVQLTNKEPKKGSYLGTISLSAPSIEARGIRFGEESEIENEEQVKWLARKMKGVDVADIDTSSPRVCPVPKEVPDSNKLKLYQGQSKIFRCDLDWSDHDFGMEPSMRAEIFARANYTFVKKAGTRSVRVKHRGK